MVDLNLRKFPAEQHRFLKNQKLARKTPMAELVANLVLLWQHLEGSESPAIQDLLSQFGLERHE